MNNCISRIKINKTNNS